MAEKKSGNKVTKSLLYSSPVLLAVALALVFSFSTIANHEETDDVIGVIDDNITPPPPFAEEFTISHIYNQYVNDPGNTAALEYEGSRITFSGVVASWSMGDEQDGLGPYITLFTNSSGLSPLSGSDNVKCYWAEGLMPGLMDGYIGDTVIITGIFVSIINDYLVIEDCDSDDIYTAEDDIATA